MTVVDKIKDAVGLPAGEPKSAFSQPPRRIGRRTDVRNRGHPRGDERRPPAAALPRLMRTPPHSVEPMSAGRVLSAVEVRGAECQTAFRLANADYRRTSDTLTKSASTKSSSNGWPRWTSCGQPRMASGAIEHGKRGFAKGVQTGMLHVYIHRAALSVNMYDCSESTTTRHRRFLGH